MPRLGRDTEVRRSFAGQCPERGGRNKSYQIEDLHEDDTLDRYIKTSVDAAEE